MKLRHFIHADCVDFGSTIAMHEARALHPNHLHRDRVYQYVHIARDVEATSAGQNTEGQSEWPLQAISLTQTLEDRIPLKVQILADPSTEHASILIRIAILASRQPSNLTMTPRRLSACLLLFVVALIQYTHATDRSIWTGIPQPGPDTFSNVAPTYVVPSSRAQTQIQSTLDQRPIVEQPYYRSRPIAAVPLREAGPSHGPADTCREFRLS